MWAVGLGILCMAAAPLDPFLPAHLRPVVEEAIEAELDAKRGPANAVELLRGAQEQAKTERDRMRLELRVAAIQIRKGFLTESTAEPPVRYQQALTTYTRLDLSEPGYAEWLSTTLQKNPDLRDTLQDALPLRLAVLSSRSIPQGSLQSRLVELIEEVGVDVEVVEPKRAEMVVMVRAENADSPDPSRVAVKTVMDLRRVDQGETAWKHRISQTSIADDASTALAASLEWNLRIGGRDLLTRWLGAHGLPLMRDGPLAAGPMSGVPSTGHGHGHDHEH